jgi:hypothetical protein
LSGLALLVATATIWPSRLVLTLDDHEIAVGICSSIIESPETHNALVAVLSPPRRWLVLLRPVG